MSPSSNVRMESLSLMEQAVVVIFLGEEIELGGALLMRVKACLTLANSPSFSLVLEGLVVLLSPSLMVVEKEKVESGEASAVDLIEEGRVISSKDDPEMSSSL